MIVTLISLMLLYRRQVQTPARPARSLSSLTRVVRRGKYSTASAAPVASSCLAWFALLILSLLYHLDVGLRQELKAQEWMQMETLMTSQPSCSIWHGTRQRTQLLVPLRTVCTCIMRRDGRLWKMFRITRFFSLFFLGRLLLVKAVSFSCNHQETEGGWR